jgi:hypothetical protein
MMVPMHRNLPSWNVQFPFLAADQLYLNSIKWIDASSTPNTIHMRSRYFRKECPLDKLPKDLK